MNRTTVSYTSDDFGVVQRMVDRGLLVVMLGFFAFIVISIGFLMVAPAGDMAALQAVGLGSLFFLSIPLLILFRLNKYRKALNHQEKEVIIRTVDKKIEGRIGGDRYEIQSGEEFFKADVTAYTRLDIGDTVEIHRCIHSQPVLAGLPMSR